MVEILSNEEGVKYEKFENGERIALWFAREIDHHVVTINYFDILFPTRRQYGAVSAELAEEVLADFRKNCNSPESVALWQEIDGGLF